MNWKEGRKEQIDDYYNIISNNWPANDDDAADYYYCTLYDKLQ